MGDRPSTVQDGTYLLRLGEKGAPMKPRTGAERYIADRLEDPDFATKYGDARRRIDDVDRIVRTIEGRRVALGLSKAELARRVGVRPEAIRRLLSGNHANPTLSTVVSLASALQLDIVAIPADAENEKLRA